VAVHAYRSDKTDYVNSPDLGEQRASEVIAVTIKSLISNGEEAFRVEADLNVVFGHLDSRQR